MVDCEFVGSRQHVFNFVSTNITTSLLKDKSQIISENLHYAAKANLSLEFVLRNVENGKNCYFHAHEINFILERSQLIAIKEELLDLQNFFDDLFFVELSIRERFSTKWKFLLATNMTVSAILPKNVPIGFNLVLLPPRLVKRTDVNCIKNANMER